MAYVELSETCPGRLGFLAGWVEADDIFVELFRMRQVHLPLFKFGGLQEFFRFVAAAAKRYDEEEGTQT